MIYVKPIVRKSLLANMLTELLDTRVMVKQGMKLARNNKVYPSFFVLAWINVTAGTSPSTRRPAAILEIHLVWYFFDHKDFLILGSNVTYGYTSASFSGRMPAVEVADSIVQSGRETLEKVRV